MPQPITSESMGAIHKLLSYSLGDFSIGFPFDNYHFGEIMRFEVGQDSNNHWAIGHLDWSFTKCKNKKQNEVIVDLIDHCPYFGNNL